MAHHHLTDDDVLNLQEAGVKQSRVEQALLILSLACPDKSREELADMSIGERDARLLKVREETFGASMDVFTTCPKCQQELELSLSTSGLLLPPDNIKKAGQVFTARIDQSTIHYRLPNSSDLEAILNCQEITQAQEIIMQRCIVAVDDEVADAKSLHCKEMISSTDFMTTFAGEIAVQDPQAEIILNMQCIECTHQWQALFDVVSFLWSELEIRAKRILAEIYVLARTYHWHERDILALSPVRRRWYLEMAS